MIVTISPVIESPEGHGFGAFMGDSKKGWQFKTEKHATIARAKFIKGLTSKGIKVAYGKAEEYI